MFNARTFPGVLSDELNFRASFRSHSLISVEVVIVVVMVVALLSSLAVVVTVVVSYTFYALIVI